MRKPLEVRLVVTSKEEEGVAISIWGIGHVLFFILRNDYKGYPYNISLSYDLIFIFLNLYYILQWKRVEKILRGSQYLK